MDLNYLFQRRKESLLMADNATSQEARHVHRELAERYELLIATAENRRAIAGAA